MESVPEQEHPGFWKAVDERLGFSRLAYRVPEYANGLPYVLGGTALACFLILVITGIFLAQFYNPSTPSTAYQSIVYVMTMVPFGAFMQSLHYWAANAFVLIILLHLVRVFISGSYKRPREFTWLTGLALLALSLGFYFTGTVLKQDQEAVEALTHNIGIGELLGGIGTWFTSGFAVSVSIVARVLFAHITILAFFFLGVLAIHLYLIKLHGISPRPARDAVSRSTEGEGESHFTAHLRRLAGWGLVLFAVLGLLAVLVPAPLGTPGILGAEVAKPPWPFLPFYGMEDMFGFPAVIWGPLILFALLAIIPFIDRSPYLSPRRRKGMMVFGAAIALVVIGFGLEAHFRKVAPPGEGLAPLIPVAYAHMIPMVTVSPDKLSPGDTLTVSGDGMPATGTYELSLESESSTFPLGAATVAEGNDSFDADFALATSTPPGSYVVKAVHASDGRTYYSLSEFAVFAPLPSTAGGQNEAQPAEPSAATVPIKNSTTSAELATIIATLIVAAAGGIALLYKKG